MKWPLRISAKYFSALENFLVRRTVCKVPPNSLKLFSLRSSKKQAQRLTPAVVKEFCKKEYHRTAYFQLRFPNIRSYLKNSSGRAKLFLSAWRIPWTQETVLSTRHHHWTILPQNEDACGGGNILVLTTMTESWDMVTHNRQFDHRLQQRRKRQSHPDSSNTIQKQFPNHKKYW